VRGDEQANSLTGLVGRKEVSREALFDKAVSDKKIGLAEDYGGSSFSWQKHKVQTKGGVLNGDHQ
jgi:hypothetical protein